MLPTCTESFFVAVVPAVILAVAGPSLGDAVAIGATQRGRERIAALDTAGLADVSATVVETLALAAAPVGRVALTRESVSQGRSVEKSIFVRTADFDAALLGGEAMASTSAFVFAVAAVVFAVADQLRRDTDVVGRAPKLRVAAPRPHVACAAGLVTPVATVTMAVAHFVRGDALIRRETL